MIVVYFKGIEKSMNRIVFALVALILFSLSPTDTQPESPTKAQKSYSNYEKTRTCYYYGFDPSPFKMPEIGNPLEMVYRFFEVNRDQCQIKNAREELVLKRQARSGLGDTIYLTQIYQKVPILNSNVWAYFDSDGKLSAIDGIYFYNIDLPTTPQIDPAVAVDIALKDLHYPGHSKVLDPPELYMVTSQIYTPSPSEEPKIFLVWITEIVADSLSKTSKYTFRRYYVNALDGSIVCWDIGFTPEAKAKKD
jgi:Zn-dependent metalloprotease